MSHAENANGRDDDAYEQSFGEPIAKTLDIESWSTGIDWESAVQKFQTEIAQAVEREQRVRTTIRNELLPKLNRNVLKIPEGGKYEVAPEDLTLVSKKILHAGRVEAVDGTCVTYDSLPIEITQIGVAVVGYGGSSSTFSQRVFRKEVASQTLDAVREAIDVLERRDQRSGIGNRDGLSELARRGVMAYAERCILLEKCSTEWRIGHGNPCPYELLTGSGGSGDMVLLNKSLEVLRKIIQGHQKFVYVPSAPGERGLLTLGNALFPGEYIIYDTLEKKAATIVESGHYPEKHKQTASQFVKSVCADILCGLYKCSERAPAYMFFAHKKHVHMAVRIVMADSIIRRERGFPLLIDIADATCRSAFGSEGFNGLIHDAYARTGAGLEHFGERQTRR